MLANHTWDIVSCSPATNVVNDKWIFCHKLKANGTLGQVKAYWVLQNFTLRLGVDYAETFSIVIMPTTVRTILYLDPSRDWTVHHLDVKNVFLHDTLTEMVYCIQPTNFVDSTCPGKVCKLNRSLYGLKQASQALYSRKPPTCLPGFVEAKSNTRVHPWHNGNTVYLLFVYDIVLPHPVPLSSRARSPSYNASS